MYLYPYPYCGDGPSDAPNKLTPRLVLTTRVRHELLVCTIWAMEDQTRPFCISVSRTLVQ